MHEGQNIVCLSHSQMSLTMWVHWLDNHFHDNICLSFSLPEFGQIIDNGTLSRLIYLPYSISLSKFVLKNDYTDIINCQYSCWQKMKMLIEMELFSNANFSQLKLFCRSLEAAAAPTGIEKKLAQKWVAFHPTFIPSISLILSLAHLKLFPLGFMIRQRQTMLGW